MDRHELEEQIRASLQTRADDVQPTPELWERVSTRTTRAARWQLGGWVLSGAAAVVAMVVGGMALFGGPRTVEIQPQPDIAESPDEVEPGPADAPATPTVVTTDGETLHRVDPDTGEVVQELFPFEGFAEGAEIHEVAVRPVSDEGVVTVAMTILIEGEYDVEVAAFDAEGNRVTRQRLGMASPEPAALAPDVVWSEDGRYVMWAGRTFLDGGVTNPGLWIHDWVENPVDENGVATPVPVLSGEAARSPMFDATAVDLREWSGPTDGDSRVLATTTDGDAWTIDLGRACGPTERCSGFFTEGTVTPFGFEGWSPMDVGTLDNGVTVALVARGDGTRSAEGIEFALLADPMSDQQRELDLPELADFTAAPGDAFLSVAGDRVLVGHPAGTPYLLTTTGDTVESTDVTDTQALADDVMNGGMAVLRRGIERSEPTEDATPTATETSEGEAPTGGDGLATHVITTPERGQFQLVDRRAPGEAVAAWTRPDGVDGETYPNQVVVHPSSTPADLEVVTRWSVGESDTFTRTVLRDGEVVLNEVMDVQPDNSGGAAETADVAPVFSTDGAWLAWVETPRATTGPSQVRVVGWGPDGPTGETTTITAPDDVTRPMSLLDWASSPEQDVLTMSPSPGPGPSAGGTMLELRLPHQPGQPADPTAAGEWDEVELPGVLFEAGSFLFEDGSERYVAYAGQDDVLYALADAPETGVPTGAYAFSEGRLVSFGPDNALVHTAGGAWQRVQVDDGATSTVSMPEATVAVLPWASPGAG